MSNVTSFTRSLERLQETQSKGREQVEVPNAVRSRHSLPVPIVDIAVEGRLRSINEEAAEHIAESMKRQGQLYPIDIRTLDEGGYQLVAGAHRIAAAKKLGWTHIEAFVGDDLPDDEIALHEIDENLCRAELNPIDKAHFFAKRKEIYQRLYPETRHGAHLMSPNRRHWADSAQRTPSFVENTAASTPWSERTIQRYTRIGERLDPALREALATTPIGRRTHDLERIADMDDGKQQKLLKRLQETDQLPPSLAALMDDQKPSPSRPDPFERLQTLWNKTAQTHQRRFFAWLEQQMDERR